MKFQLPGFARRLNYSVNGIVSIMIFSGLYSLSLLFYLLMHLIKKDSLIEKGIGIQYLYFMPIALLVFVVCILLLKIKNKYYKDYVLINGKYYKPQPSQNWNDAYRLKYLDSICFYCIFKDECTAPHLRTGTCNFFSPQEDILLCRAIRKAKNMKEIQFLLDQAKR
jgi:hypothetical protein